MDCCKQLLFIFSLLIAFLISYVYRMLTQIPEIPKFDVDKWWGTAKVQKNDSTIREFKIEFTDELIADLKNRLALVSLTPPLEGAGFEYGFNNNYLKEVIQFWSKDYKFKERETFLNKYPQFLTNIQGLDVHYIHVKPTVTNNVKVLPLLLVHGWPGSIREFYDIIPLLSTPRNDQDFVFELIVPSIPGYGFSKASAKRGLGMDEVAIIMRNLMHRLGHRKYYVQGGDFGAYIVQTIAIYFPEEVLGLHTNTAFVSTEMSLLKWIIGVFYPSLVIADEYRHWLYPVLDKVKYVVEETGFMHLQATKPDTIGVGLRDSPAGLAAYILEKFSTLTDRDFRKLPDGGITQKYSLTDVLDNVMIYWTSGCITTSMRLYAESFSRRSALKFDYLPIYVPSAIANFKNVVIQSEFILKDKFVNIVQINYFNGGFFAAFELPREFADDIWLAVSKMRRGIYHLHTKMISK